MKSTTINNTNLEITPINLGGNVFGWTLDEKESFALLDAFVAKGGNFIDTADMYAYWVDGKEGGQSETILGKWMASRKNRKDIIIATKVGGATGLHPKDTSKAHILAAAEKSLERLQTDYIDLYYTHFDDEKTPVKETLEAYDILIKSGKVKYIAASNISPDRLEESFAVASEFNLPTYVALQPHYNLVERTGYEKDYAVIAKKYNLSVFPYWSLASGFLTGKYRTEEDLNKSVRGGSAKAYLNKKGLAVLAALDKAAAKHETSAATISLAWLLAQPQIAAPLASATNETQLQTLFDAACITLDKEDLEHLEAASK